MIFHVYPINDIKEHDIESTTCHCHPEVEIIEESGNILVIHNSFDGRELLEELYAGQ